MKKTSKPHIPVQLVVINKRGLVNYNKKLFDNINLSISEKNHYELNLIFKDNCFIVSTYFEDNVIKIKTNKDLIDGSILLNVNSYINKVSIRDNDIYIT